MKRFLTVVASLGLAACATPGAVEKTSAASRAAEPDAVQVMVLGAFHMGNPGQDVANAEIDDMLTDERQAEITAVADALADFKPTVVAVERITEAPGYLDPKYQAFTPEMLKENPDERYQIGYRLAKQLGIDRVYGVDEQPSDGEPDYFPFDELMAHAAATGQSDVMQGEIAEIQAQMADFSAMQKDNSVADLLLMFNSDGPLSSPEFYYRTFFYDRGETQPGAELQAYWFMRNAKIFSKLVQVTKPGDRVVIVYGAGHKFWLDHFAENTPGYVLVDPAPYLEKAAAE
ncbi:DUF5694 domain-containing protein [Hyphococcus sp.]|jgi:hypothetical protein|uniref:DUF5694 domain-containing protein n=1 Tax=Hyphococcus sp. TaxID=2038636 RepID=UPI003D0A9E6A